MSGNKRFIEIDVGVLLDIETNEDYVIVEELVDVLNDLDEKNKKLEKRIKQQEELIYQQGIQIIYLLDTKKTKKW